MRLFKIILVIFAVYFIRRFFQLYRAMEKRGREMHEEQKKTVAKAKDGNTIEAEYKIVDR